MQKNWNKEIDIELLVNKIIGYLIEKDFEIIKKTAPDGYQILASDSPFFKMAGHVQIYVKGTNDGFTVDVKHSDNVGNIGEVSRSITLTTLFGGGYFLLKKLKSREAWIIFENELWKYINETVHELSTVSSV